MNRWWLLGLVLATAGCKKKSPATTKVAVGEACTQDYQCDYKGGIWCFEGKCRAKGQIGERCLGTSDCAGHMPCFANACVTRERHAQLLEEERVKAEAAQRKAEAEKEARLLREGGIIDTPIAEAPTTMQPPGPGARIRTVTLRANGTVFAPCKPDERLVGGGCRSTYALIETYSSHHGDQDTMGGRWNCGIREAGSEVTAFAYCQKP